MRILMSTILGVVEGKDGSFYGVTIGYQNGSGVTPPGHVYKFKNASRELKGSKTDLFALRHSAKLMEKAVFSHERGGAFA